MDVATDTAAAAEDSTDVDVLSNGQRSAAVDVKSSPMQQKSAGIGKGPLKSIMKKREERHREKTQRKESDLATSAVLAAPKRGSHFKEFLELHVSKSPRHSMSLSSVVGATSTAGDTLHGAAPDTNAVRRTTTDTDTAPYRASSRHLSTDSPVDAAVSASDVSLQNVVPGHENSASVESKSHAEQELQNSDLEDNTQL